MSDNDDTKPDVNDPELDDFTNVMTDGAEGGGVEFGILYARRDSVRAVQNAMCDAFEAHMKTNEVLHMEVLIALSNMFAGLAGDYLARFDLDLFPANQQQVLQLVGLMAYQVNDLKPTQQQLAEAPLPPLVTLN